MEDKKSLVPASHKRIHNRLERDPLFRERALAGETLTPKQRLLCEEYASTGQVLASAKRAGYSTWGGNSIIYKKAKAILTRPDAQLYISQKKGDIEERKTASREYIVTKLKELVETPKGVKPSEKINALTVLAKVAGLMKESPDSGRVVVFQTVGLDEQKPQFSAIYEPSEGDE